MQPDTDIENGTPALSSEAAADWGALEQLAAADPNVQPDPNAPEPPPPPAPLGEELAGMLFMMSKVLAPAFPSLATIYTEEACGAVGGAVAGVCDKYGWLQGGVGGEYGPELMCLCVVGPIAFATYGAVQGDIAARKEKERPKGEQLTKTPQGAYRAPGADTVTIGAPIA